MDMDFKRRFSGVRRLYGDDGIAKLNASHVVVVGMGGVGSWAAEVLARNAVGNLTLIDMDHVAESNFNRQLHAVEDNIGKSKVSAMLARILAINPACQVHAIDDFITPENIHQLLQPPSDVVLDCIDDAKAKVALALFCRQAKRTLLMSGGAGGRLDPTKVQVADLAHVQGDKLLAKVRNLLRREHGFPKGSDALKKSAKLSLNCVYSNEPVMQPSGHICFSDASLTGLNCAGYGSSVSVTASFGMLLAQLALNQLLKS